ARRRQLRRHPPIRRRSPPPRAPRALGASTPLVVSSPSCPPSVTQLGVVQGRCLTDSDLPGRGSFFVLTSCDAPEEERPFPPDQTGDPAILLIPPKGRLDVSDSVRTTPGGQKWIFVPSFLARYEIIPSPNPRRLHAPTCGISIVSTCGTDTYRGIDQ